MLSVEEMNQCQNSYVARVLHFRLNGLCEQSDSNREYS
jgi:hypothetical protein